MATATIAHCAAGTTTHAQPARAAHCFRAPQMASKALAGRALRAAGVARRRVAPAQPAALFGGGTPATGAKSIYDFTVEGIDGKPIPFSRFKGKVLLIANVASQCGFTPQASARVCGRGGAGLVLEALGRRLTSHSHALQYDEFTELFNKYNSKGLEVIAFPCK